jgi:8-oxo-dGTP diphosphatase
MKPSKDQKKPKKRIRNSVKAIIFQKGKLLVIRKRNASGSFCALPGGGQKKSETLAQALKRECMEELGAHVKVGDLLYVRDYISANHQPYDPAMPHHKVEFYFACELKGSFHPAGGAQPDPAQLDVVWADPEQLVSLNFYPRVLRTILADLESASQSSVYLGDVN